MPYCPLCKTEDTDGYGYCRECGVPTVAEGEQPRKPSRAALWGDKIGTFVTQVILISLTTVFSAYLGGFFGAVVGILGLLTTDIALIACIVSGMFAACFLLGWFTSPWIQPVTAFVGTMLPAFVLLLTDSFANRNGKPDIIYLFLFASIGAVSIICGTRLRQSKKWYLIVIPILWAAIVIAVVVTSSN